MNEPIMFELEGGAVENADELYSGATVSKEGYYHVECVDVQLKTPNIEAGDKPFTPNVNLHLHIIGGEHADQVEKLIYHRINLKKYDKDANNYVPLDDRAMKNIRCLCYAFGLISANDVANPKLKVNFTGLLDKQAIVKVTHEPPQKYIDKDGLEQMSKDRWKIAWHNDIFHVADERVKDVPKDMQAVGLALQASSPEQMNNEMDNLLSGI